MGFFIIWNMKTKNVDLPFTQTRNEESRYVFNIVIGVCIVLD